MISIIANVWLRYKLHRMGMPENYGLMENNLILRKHNDSFVKKISNDWWNAFSHGIAKRDQLYLMRIANGAERRGWI